jgi:hypothetical protein
MLRHVALVRTDVSEERSASIIRVTRIAELGTTLAVTSKWCTLWRNSMWLKSFEDFYVWSGSRIPRRYSIGPDWFEYCFVYESFAACGGFRLRPSSQYVLMIVIPSCFLNIMTAETYRNNFLFVNVYVGCSLQRVLSDPPPLSLYFFCGLDVADNIWCMQLGISSIMQCWNTLYRYAPYRNRHDLRSVTHIFQLDTAYRHGFREVFLFLFLLSLSHS